MSVVAILENGLRQMRRANEALLEENKKLTARLNAVLILRHPPLIISPEPEPDDE